MAYTNIVFVLLYMKDTFDSIIWRTTEIIRLVIHYLRTAQQDTVLFKCFYQNEK